jgi:AsmA protein
MRLLFRIVIALIAAVGLVIGGLLLLPGEKIAGIVADQVKSHTGRDLRFDGKVSISLWPVLGVRTGPVVFGNADWAGVDAPPMLQAEGLSIGVSAPDLLGGEIRVKKVAVVAPQLHLSTRADGQGNWVFGEPATEGSEPTAEGGSTLPLQIEEVQLKRASLTYAAFGSTPVEISDVDLTLLWPEPGGTADLKVTLRPAGEAVEVEAQIGTFEAFLAGQVASVGATVRAAGARARFDGRASVSGEAAGRVSLDAPDTDKLMQAAGLGALGLQPGMGRSVVLGTDMTYTRDGRLALRDLDLRLDQNQIAGAVDLRLADVPHVTAKLRAGKLDFSALTAAEGGSASGRSSGSGWPQDPIDASALGLLNGSIELDVEGLDTGSVVLGPSAMALTIDRSRAVLGLKKVAVFGGTMTGQLVANNRNGLSVGGNLSGADLDTKIALTQLADIDTINGQVQTQLEFLGVGNTMDAIMRSLSGKGWFELGKGFFTGFDLEELMRSGSGNGGSTVFDSLTASYTMKDGNLFNKDLLLMIKGFRIEGEGRIGLGTQDLDYSFTPEATSGGRALRIPVRVTGPWASPSIRPDLSKALDAEIEVKKDEIEAKAKDVVKRKLEEELETTITDGQDAKEVLKDALENKAKEGLFKLLSGD